MSASLILNQLKDTFEHKARKGRSASSQEQKAEARLYAEHARKIDVALVTMQYHGKKKAVRQINALRSEFTNIAAEHDKMAKGASSSHKATAAAYRGYEQRLSKAAGLLLK